MIEDVRDLLCLDDRFESLHDLRRQFQIEAGEILTQMLRACAAREWQYADCAGEAENQLRGSSSESSRHSDDWWVLQDLGIRGEQREALIDHIVFGAEFSHLSVPLEAGEAAVLHECGQFHSTGLHLIEVMQSDVAYAQQSRAACVAFFSHCFPDFRIRVGPFVV